MKKNTIIVIIMMFLFSLIIRSYAIINAPFDKGYLSDELGGFTNLEVSAHNKYIVSTWDNYSPTIHHFTLTIGKGDERWADNKNSDVFKTYTSFPPIAFIIPYFLSKFFGVTNDFYNRWMQIWSLLLNLICGFLIYKIGEKVINKDKENDKSIYPLLCVMIYYFNPNVLHYTSNVYWTHQFYQPVFLSFLYWVLSNEETSMKNKSIFLWAFCLSFITWTGIATCGGWFLAYFILYKKEKGLSQKLFSIVGGVVSALFINAIWISSTIEKGVIGLIDAIIRAYSDRTNGGDLIVDVKRLFRTTKYEYMYLCILILMCFIVLLYLGKKSKTSIKIITKKEVLIYIITFITCCESILLIKSPHLHCVGKTPPQSL